MRSPACHTAYGLRRKPSAEDVMSTVLSVLGVLCVSVVRVHTQQLELRSICLLLYNSCKRSLSVLLCVAIMVPIVCFCDTRP